MTNKIFNVAKNTDIPKYEQVIRAVTEAIEEKKIGIGDPIPSLNQANEIFHVSLNTVVKAYSELKKRGIIDSVNGKYHHVISDKIDRKINLFLLFDELNSFKELLYNSIKSTLEPNSSVDIFFHHYNFHSFESQILENIGRYNSYLIIPHPAPESEQVLRQLDADKVLILDQKHHISDQYAFLVQDFENETYACLCKGLERIKKYKEFVFLTPNKSRRKDKEPFSNEIIKGSKRFCKENNIKFSVCEELFPRNIRHGALYISITDEELILFVKICQLINWSIGKDIGIISFNENPLKEIIGKGITTISTDFKRMGEVAAESIINKEKIQEINPAHIIIRDSI